MNKAAVSAKLDWDELLGFDQISDARTLIRKEMSAFAPKVGSKVGNKVGNKVGVKIGVKVGLKA
jgi:hypothetical protein